MCDKVWQMYGKEMCIDYDRNKDPGIPLSHLSHPTPSIPTVAAHAVAVSHMGAPTAAAQETPATGSRTM